MTAYEKVGAMVCVFVHCLIWEEFKLMRLETNESLFVQVLKTLFVYLCTECSSINLFYLRAMSALCLSVCVCVLSAITAARLFVVRNAKANIHGCVGK